MFCRASNVSVEIVSCFRGTQRLPSVFRCERICDKCDLLVFVFSRLAEVSNVLSAPSDMRQSHLNIDSDAASHMNVSAAGGIQ